MKEYRTGADTNTEMLLPMRGYSSEENYTYLENKKINAYIKPSDYEVRKTKRFKNNPYRTENLFYDDANDCFICPNGNHLYYAYDSHSRTENDYTVTKKNYVCESCAGCSQREQCFKGRYENRKISLSQTMARQKREAA